MFWAGLFLLFFFTNNLPLIKAQSINPQLSRLEVEMWPEYDRPEVLVIYRVELAPNTALPAQLTFQVPSYVEEMNAVAFEENGVLFEIDEASIDLRPGDDSLWLTFSTTTHRVQFEYYDPVILVKQNQERQLGFNFSAPSDIEMATFQIQEPLATEEFLLTPAPSSRFTSKDGLTYNAINIAGLASGETIDFNATYQRGTDELTVQLANRSSSQRVRVITDSEATVNNPPIIGFVLVVAGLLLLVGVGGYWWISKTVNSEQ